MTAFAVPASLEEADARKKQLIVEIFDFQSQLGDRQRKDANGERMSSADYQAWRTGTRSRLNCKLEELRSLKEWIAERRGTALSMLKEAHALLCVLETDDVALSPDEKATIKKIGHYLKPFC